MSRNLRAFSILSFDFRGAQPLVSGAIFKSLKFLNTIKHKKLKILKNPKIKIFKFWNFLNLNFEIFENQK